MQHDTDIANNAIANYGVDQSQVVLDSQGLIDEMRSNLNVFASVVLPDEFTEKFSDSHVIMWQLLTESASKGYIDEAVFDKFALGLPRGHAKTTMLKLLCAWIVLFTARRYLLIVCSTATKAESFVADVISLLASPNIIELFGAYDRNMEKNNEKIKKFTYRGRRLIIKPTGKSGSIRGMQEDFQRPDVIICDDIQEQDEAENEEISQKILTWFLGTLLKARHPRVCTIVYLGNMYRDLEIGKSGSGIYTCLLRNLELNTEWTSMIVGAILSDGTALWEEVQSKKALLSDLRQDTQLGQEDIFFAEVLNDPTAKNSMYWKPSQVPDLPYSPYDQVIGKYLVIDPSLGKKKSDDQVVGLFYVYDETGPVLHEARVIQKSAPDLVQEVLKWALAERVPLITAEGVAYQSTLVQWFIFFCEQLGVEGIAIHPVTPRGFSKVARILAYLKSLMRGYSKCTPEAFGLISSQAAFYRPSASNNVDDILDVGAYGEQVYLEFADQWLVDVEASYEVIGSNVDTSEDTYTTIRIPQ